jgi:hypothetical protein
MRSSSVDPRLRVNPPTVTPVQTLPIVFRRWFLHTFYRATSNPAIASPKPTPTPAVLIGAAPVLAAVAVGVFEALTDEVLLPLGQEGAVFTTTFSSLHSCEANCVVANKSNQHKFSDDWEW